MAKKWYVVHTYTQAEDAVKTALEKKIKAEGISELFEEILIPREKIIDNKKKGKNKITERKFFSGYIFVKMEMDDEAWHIVKSIPKVTGFLGGKNPTPLPESEIVGIQAQIAEGKSKPRPKIKFAEGEKVRVKEGPFSNFEGIVEEVKPDKQKLRVLVSIFGRATPVELEYTQVEKT
ncbi:MAG: transcription termination/antitermination protein NusG [Myxococcota bacterium]